MLLARILGPFYLVIALAFLVNKNMYKDLVAHFKKSDGAVWTFSMFALLIGLLMVNVHNIWEWSYKGLITLFGWGAVIKGIIFMVWPDSFIRWSEKQAKKSWWTGFAILFTLIIGLWLSYMGYWA